MGQEQDSMAKRIELMQADIAKYRKNEERWSQRVTKLMEKIIGLEQQIKELETAGGGTPNDQQETPSGDVQQKTASGSAQRLIDLTEALSEPLMPLVERAKGMMDNEMLAAEQRRQLEEIHQLAKKIQKIVFYEQEVARMEAGVARVEPDWFDLGRFSKELTDDFSRQAEAKKVFFAFSREGTFAGKWKADHARIGLVLTAVFDRALKKTSKGNIGMQVVCVPSDEGPNELAFVFVYGGLEGDSVLINQLSNSDESDESKRDLGDGGMELDILRRQARLLGGSLTVNAPTGRKPLLRFALPAEYASDEETKAPDKPAMISL